MFQFKTVGIEFEPLSRLYPAKHVSYQFSESIKSLSLPLILTAWSQEELYVALPMLSCSPKVIRVAFQHSNDVKDATVGAIQTLQSPVYFPSSTPYRNPQIVIHKSPAKSPNRALKPGKHLVLALDRDQTPKLGDNLEQWTLPPIVMAWPIPEASSWREWNLELDERSEELKNNQKTSAMLRGTFVDSENRYSMPIRSGLDWRKKAFVSCG